MEREDAAGHRGQEEGEAETEGTSDRAHTGSMQHISLPFHAATEDCAADSLVASIDRGVSDEQWAVSTRSLRSVSRKT